MRLRAVSKYVQYARGTKVFYAVAREQICDTCALLRKCATSLGPVPCGIVSGPFQRLRRRSVAIKYRNSIRCGIGSEGQIA
jgi:hypothetical protein